MWCSSHHSISGPVAQLGARVNGIHEVTGSIPVWSTISKSLILTAEISNPLRRSNRCAYVAAEVRPLCSGLLNRYFRHIQRAREHLHATFVHKTRRRCSGASSWALLAVVAVFGRVHRVDSGRDIPSAGRQLGQRADSYRLGHAGRRDDRQPAVSDAGRKPVEAAQHSVVCVEIAPREKMNASSNRSSFC